MIVDVKYQIEFDDIPKLCTRLVEDAYTEAYDVGATIGGTCETFDCGDYIAAISELETLRSELMKIDIKLGNAQDLIKGYLAALAGKDETSGHNKREPLTSAELEEKLLEYRENWGSLGELEGKIKNEIG